MLLYNGFDNNNCVTMDTSTQRGIQLLKERTFLKHNISTSVHKYVHINEPIWWGKIENKNGGNKKSN